MTAALFGVVVLLVSLAKDGDAPKLFSKKIKKIKYLPLPSLILATIGLSASIITALLLPGKIYEYITTAAGILLLYNWAFIIISSIRVLDGIKFKNKVIAFIGLLFITTAISGTLMEKSIRPGFWVSLCILGVIGLFTMKFGRNKKAGSNC
ncbi:amino acid permease [Gracilibacillus boraciitolerans JCM 21714]|uniref:Amino acid permease n=1 Tax=Gracilibacillus boraciitolerans JCM 21714 TaxID=1298598 RepID=W4VHU1_9BACI|nr:amino acid permease [Gracilibacillus boraciitolerans JCM 21714]